MYFTEKQMLEAVNKYYCSRKVKYYIGGSKSYESIVYSDGTRRIINYYPDGEVRKVCKYDNNGNLILTKIFTLNISSNTTFNPTFNSIPTKSTISYSPESSRCYTVSHKIA